METKMNQEMTPMPTEHHSGVGKIIGATVLLVIGFVAGYFLGSNSSMTVAVQTAKMTATPSMIMQKQSLTVGGLTMNLPEDWILKESTSTTALIDVDDDFLKLSVNKTRAQPQDEYINGTAINNGGMVYSDGCGGGRCWAYIIKYDSDVYNVLITNDSGKLSSDSVTQDDLTTLQSTTVRQ